jgi:hypothetical protein
MLAVIWAGTPGCNVAVESETTGLDVQKTFVGLLPGKLTLCTALPMNMTHDEVPPLHMVLKSEAMQRLPVRVMPFTW